MEFGKAFVYQFEDQEWLKKLGIGALLLLIPLLGQLWIAGWSLEITKRVIRRDPQPLADWDDFGGYLVRGFLVFIIGFVYALPIILVSACVSVLFPSAFDLSASNEVATSAWIVVACVNCVIVLYSILLALFIPAALGNFAVKEQFGAAFRFGEVWGLVRAAPGAYILVFLGTILTGFIAGLGIILCFIGVVITISYANSVMGNLMGQAYNVATAEQQLEPVEAV
jgi:hypothetical protein